jgi:hypothetical protein
MSKYIVRYVCKEYYEKEYEADSPYGAERAYYMDSNLFNVKPHDSDIEMLDVFEKKND